MTQRVTDRQIAEFVAEVRKLLQDLKQTDLEGLTEGLENDLSDQRDTDSNFRLANPRSYASELRISAGLPASNAEPSRAAANFAKAAKATWKFLKTFETTGFVIRGYLFYPLVFSPLVFKKVTFFPHSFLALLIVAAFVALSLLIGNGRGIFKFLKYPLIAINTIAVVASAFVLVQAKANYEEYSSLKVMNESGSLYKGNQLLNYMCAFDASGKQVEYAKLTDHLGMTVLTYQDVEPYSKDCTDAH